MVKYTLKQQVWFYTKRGLKALSAFVVSALVVYASDNPDWYVLMPAFVALEKLARDKGYWFSYGKKK